VQGNLAKLPVALDPLKALPNWVCWRWQQRADGSWCKPPFTPQGGSARDNDPATWSNYDEALAGYQAGGFDGIGFVLLNTKFAAFDLDNCRNLVTGKILPEAMQIVRRCGYTEITPSGTGLRVLGTGNGSCVQRKQKLPGSVVSVESYSNCARYITVTGKPLQGSPRRLDDIGKVIDAVVAELDGAPAGAGYGNGHDREREPGLDEWIKANGDRYASLDIDESKLPAALKALIADIPAATDMSEAFHHAVNWLHDLKWSAYRIESYLDGAPVTPPRYEGRLLTEVYRSLRNAELDKARAKTKQQQDKTKQQQNKAKAAATPLGFVDMRDWDTTTDPEQEWLVDNHIPLGQPTLISGSGGTGKSILLMQLLATTTLTLPDWIGLKVNHGPAIYWCAEDTADVVRRRLRVILNRNGKRFADMIAGGFKLLTFPDEDAALAIHDRDNGVQPTALYHQLDAAARQLKPKLIVIDTLSDVFIGDEIDRAQVRQFNTLMRRLAQHGNSAVIVASHPSLTGMNTGSGLSGTTQWHNSVRSRAYFVNPDEEKNSPLDNGVRELRFLKNQYGKRGAPIELQWVGGMWLPLLVTDTQTRDAGIDAMFMMLLKRFNEQDRPVSPNKSPTYAPAKFERQPEAKLAGIKSAAFELAMERLLAAGKIRVVDWGLRTRPRSKLVVV
jgi:RecA-family ATPase